MTPKDSASSPTVPSTASGTFSVTSTVLPSGARRVMSGGALPTMRTRTAEPSAVAPWRSTAMALMEAPVPALPGGGT
ncbi:hypothetical protein ACJ2CR_04330 [Myxococcus faecalis]|uniref:hypothetical protein n=1 Tax=Myxococcus faecalis TaxID=3115646 RepID=UPI0038D20A9E